MSKPGAAASPSFAGNRRLLIFTNNAKALNPAVQHLQHQKYTVILTSQLADPLETIRAARPDVVLVNWGFGAEQVKQIYQDLRHALPDLLCVIFSESTGPRDTASLIRSGIPTTIFPPLSGKGVQTRVEMFLRKRDQAKDKAPGRLRLRDLADGDAKQISSLRVVKPSDLPGESEISWQEIPLDLSSLAQNPQQIKCWMSHPKSAQHRLPFKYYVESEERPHYDVLSRSWEVLNPLSPILAQETEREPLSPVLAHLAMNIDEFRQEALKLDRRLVPVPSKLGATVKTFQDYRNDNSLEPGPTERLVRSAAPNVFFRNQGDSHKVTQLQTVGAVLVNTPRFQGYLLIGDSGNTYDSELLKAFEAKFQAAAGISRPSALSTDVVRVELDPIRFGEWNKRLEFVATFPHKGEEIAVAYIPTTNIPEPVQGEDQLLKVMAADNLFPESNLTFDLFLHMPKNQKYLLYLKRGAKITEASLARLQKFNVQDMAISKADLELFISYLIKGVLK